MNKEDLKVALVVAEDMARLAADPALALATADLDEWRAAHPCECEGGLCECED
jgi:hypothetical protein